MAVLVALARPYDHFAAVPDVLAAFGGIAAGAAGLAVGTGIKMAVKGQSAYSQSWSRAAIAGDA